MRLDTDYSTTEFQGLRICEYWCANVSKTNLLAIARSNGSKMIQRGSQIFSLSLFRFWSTVFELKVRTLHATNWALIECTVIWRERTCPCVGASGSVCAAYGWCEAYSSQSKQQKSPSSSTVLHRMEFIRPIITLVHCMNSVRIHRQAKDKSVYMLSKCISGGLSSILMGYWNRSFWISLKLFAVFFSTRRQPFVDEEMRTRSGTFSG